MKEVRPTSGKVLQALFNMIGPLKDKSFLDLFSGTGRVALEAWKRNADNIVAVELLRNRSSLIKLPNNSEGGRKFTVLSMDVRRAVKFLIKKGFAFDVVFADPPYNAGWPDKILEIVINNPDLLLKGGQLFLEHTVREPLSEIGKGWVLSDQRRYGDTCLSIISRKEESIGGDIDETSD